MYSDFERTTPTTLKVIVAMQTHTPVVTRKKPSISPSAYVMLSFPLGFLYFVFIVAGLALSIALLPFFIGLPVLLGMFSAAFAIAGYERSLAYDVLGIVEYEPDAAETEAKTGFFQRVKRAVTDPASYLNILFCLLKLPIGIINFVVTVVLVLFSICLIAMPGVYIVLDRFVSIDLFVQLPWLTEHAPQLTSLQLSIICSAAGIVLLILSAFIIHLLASGTARLTLALAKPKHM